MGFLPWLGANVFLYWLAFPSVSPHLHMSRPQLSSASSSSLNSRWSGVYSKIWFFGLKNKNNWLSGSDVQTAATAQAEFLHVRGKHNWTLNLLSSSTDCSCQEVTHRVRTAFKHRQDATDIKETFFLWSCQKHSVCSSGRNWPKLCSWFCSSELVSELFLMSSGIPPFRVQKSGGKLCRKVPKGLCCRRTVAQVFCMPQWMKEQGICVFSFFWSRERVSNWWKGASFFALLGSCGCKSSDKLDFCFSILSVLCLLVNDQPAWCFSVFISVTLCHMWHC